MTAQPDAATVVPDDESESALASQKRKLSDLNDQPKVNGSTEPEQTTEHVAKSEPEETSDEQTLQDVFLILRANDITPSVLDHTFDEEKDGTDEPVPKRPKLSEDPQALSIAAQFDNNGYKSLRSLLHDVERTCESILDRIQESATAAHSITRLGQGLLPSDELHRVSKILAYKKFTHDLITEVSSRAHIFSKETAQTNGTGTNVNGVKLETTEDEVLQEGRAVLSVFANAQGPKQLFSSLQNEQRVSLGKSLEFDESMSISTPIPEALVPNFLTLSRTSQLTSHHISASRRRKIGDVFGVSFGRQIPELQVPKPSNRLLTKSNVVNWVPYDSVSKSATTRAVYNWSTTKQSSGQWLGYGGRSAAQDAAVLEAKRRQRDRALSTGALPAAVPSESSTTEEQAKEEALFRNAFSSFAPCVDNSGATIPHHIRNDIWWEKIGKQRADDVFVDPALLDLSEQSEELEADSTAEDKLFEDTVNNFDASLLPNLSDNEGEESDKDDVDQKLEEISNLLETLYSFQKTRNSQLPPTSVPITPMGTRQPLADMFGTAEVPSSPELQVYKSLKAKLAMLVLELPPYAVSRMQGHKYGDLAVSTSIILETDDEAGIMEDDAPPAKAKPISTPASGQPQTITPRPSTATYGPHSMAGNQYGRTPAAAPLPGRGNTNYYPQQSPQISRTPSISYNRGSNSANNYPSYVQSASRQNYGPSNSAYNSTPPRPTYPQSASYGAQQTQAAAASSRAPYNLYYQPGSQQNSYNRQYSTPQAPTYGQRPQVQQYGYTPQPVQSPNMRTASPMQQNSVTPAAPYSRTPSAQSVRPQYYGPPQASALGPSGFHTSMTTQEQQSLMERQRAQLAMQNQTRQPATPNTADTVPVLSNAAHSPQRQTYDNSPVTTLQQALSAQVNGTTEI